MVPEKKGIKLIKPSDNLCRSYIKKAENSLMSMRLNSREGIKDWTASTAYYARYHMLYALLMKCGIRSEIHDCSIEIAKKLLRGFVGGNLIGEMESAKKQRIDMQYYTDRIVEDKQLNKNVKSAGNFVLKIKNIINKITEEDISKIRSKLKSLTH